MKITELKGNLNLRQIDSGVVAIVNYYASKYQISQTEAAEILIRKGFDAEKEFGYKKKETQEGT